MKARVQSRQRGWWVRDTVLVAQAVASGNNLVAPLFWIRLYGILHEVHNNVASLRRTSEGLYAAVRAIDGTLEAIRDLAATFSTDELMYVQYRRDVECHPVQDNYEFAVKKSGEPKTSLSIKLLGEEKNVSLIEFRDAITRVIGSPPNEPILAKAFAVRCGSALRAVEGAAARLYLLSEDFENQNMA